MHLAAFTLSVLFMFLHQTQANCVCSRYTTSIEFAARSRDLAVGWGKFQVHHGSDVLIANERDKSDVQQRITGRLVNLYRIITKLLKTRQSTLAFLVEQKG